MVSIQDTTKGIVVWVYFMTKRGEMTMTAGELISLLMGFNEETEVRIASQPNYPFEHSIAGAVDGRDIYFEGTETEHGVLYLLEEKQFGYFRKDAWNMV